MAAVSMLMPAIYAAEPVAIDFEDIFNQPMNRDPSCPDFTWRGVKFSGGCLWRTSPFGSRYETSRKNAVVMFFPPGSTDVSFDVDGIGGSIILFEYMNLQVWDGGLESGTVVATIPLPSPIHQFRPPKHRITVPGPVYDVTIFTAPPPSGLKEYGNTIVIDNVRYTPPDPDSTFAFDLPANADQRVLIHKYGDDSYPSPQQTDDRQIRVEGTVKLNGQPAAGKTIYFRLKDPADTALYVQNAGDASIGDNVDGPGKLNGSNQPVTAMSDGAGRISLTLEVTDHVAGDNYQIEASTKASFSCAPSCPKSALYTSWKRVYVEVNKMFRRGAFLTRDVVAGERILPVSDVRPFPSEPFKVRLIHGPTPGSSQTTFHFEEVMIVKVVRQTPLSFFVPQPGELHLDPSSSGVQYAYDGPPVLGQMNPNRRLFAADAVGHVTGDRAADYYLVDGKLVNPLFESAFTEHVWLTDATAVDSDLRQSDPRMYHDGVVPFVHELNRNDPWEREWLTHKWSNNVTRGGVLNVAKPNHHILFTSSRKRDVTRYAETTVASGYNDLWMYLDRIPGGVEPEALVHEFAHEWKVNQGTVSQPSGGHCDRALGAGQAMTTNASLKCTMTSNMYQDSAASDGVVGFHYVKLAADGNVHSEFLHIRRRNEPVPQSDISRGGNPQ